MTVKAQNFIRDRDGAICDKNMQQEFVDSLQFWQSDIECIDRVTKGQSDNEK